MVNRDDNIFLASKKTHAWPYVSDNIESSLNFHRRWPISSLIFQRRDVRRGFSDDHKSSLKRRNPVVEDGKKILFMRRLLCSKQENIDLILPPQVNKRRKNEVSKCGCLRALKSRWLILSKIGSIVKNIILKHNHPLTIPSKLRYLSINRFISSTSRLLFKTLLGNIRYVENLLC